MFTNVFFNTRKEERDEDKKICYAVCCIARCNGDLEGGRGGEETGAISWSVRPANERRSRRLCDVSSGTCLRGDKPPEPAGKARINLTEVEISGGEARFQGESQGLLRCR